MKKILLLLSCLWFVWASSGCGPDESRMLGTMKTPMQGMITQEELRDLLNIYRDYYVSHMKQTAARLDEASKSSPITRLNLRMRSRITSAVDAMLEPSDPIVAFLEMWGLVIRIRLYLEEGEGRTLYGSQQPTAVLFAQETEEEIERIGRMFLNEEKFQTARDNLLRFARQNPIRGTYSNLIVMATKESREGPNPLMNVVTIPMAPFSAMRGVDRTADAVYQFRNTAERFTDVVKELPETTRWEMLRFADELGDAEIARSFLNSLQTLSESSARLATAAEALSGILEDPNSSQAALQETLTLAQHTASEIRTAIDSLDQTGRTLKETAVEVEKAAATSKALIELFTVKTPRNEKAGPPFTMQDFDAMIGHIGQTADKINQVVVNLRQAADAPQTIPQIQGLADHLAKRAFQLLLVFFGLLLVYQLLLRFVFRKASGSVKSA